MTVRFRCELTRFQSNKARFTSILTCKTNKTRLSVIFKLEYYEFFDKAGSTTGVKKIETPMFSL